MSLCCASCGLLCSACCCCKDSAKEENVARQYGSLCGRWDEKTLRNYEQYGLQFFIDKKNKPLIPLDDISTAPAPAPVEVKMA